MLALATLACGCSYSMHEYQAAGYAPATPTSGGAPRQAVWIHARANQGVILGVTDNTDYVDEAYQRLLAQCPGDIVAVNTRYSTKLGFLSYRNTVEMQAFCLE
jgi:ribosomal protein S2